MNIVISNVSTEPIYQQIVTQLKEAIIRGELAAGAILPSIRTLAKELRISVITTKRAYEELERDGLVVTVPGKGSFVAAKNPELLREGRMRIVEEKLADAIEAAKVAGLSQEEVEEMFRILYEEE